MKKYTLLGSLLCLLLSCSEPPTLQEIDLKRLIDLEIAVFHLPEQNFSPFGSMFLEQTEGVSPGEVKQLLLFEDKVYILYAQALHSFDFASGTRNPQFAPEDGAWEIVDFDIDSLQQRIYAIDGKQQKLLCLDMQGREQFAMALSPEHEYYHLRIIDSEHLLLTINSMPVAVSQIVNLPQKSLRTLEHPVKNSFTLNAEQLQSLKQVAPLYLFSRSGEGLLAKYIFNDTIFRYTAQDREPVFYTAMNSGKLQWEKGPKLFKNNKQAALYGLWRIWDDQWLCKVRQKKDNRIFPFLVLCDTLMTPYEKNPSMDHPENGLMWENANTRQYFWINGNTDMFVDEDKRIIFTLVEYDAKRTVAMDKKIVLKLPDNLVNHPNKKELMLCYYKLKEGAIRS